MPVERITCEDVRVGDRIARTRELAPRCRVTAIDEGPVSRRLHLRRLDRPQTFNIRPARTAKLWRVERTPWQREIDASMAEEAELSTFSPDERADLRGRL